MANLSSTLQPVLFLTSLRIKHIKDPSASVNPVINQGFSEEVILHLCVPSGQVRVVPLGSKSVEVLEIPALWSPAKRVDQYSLVSTFRPFSLTSISSPISI